MTPSPGHEPLPTVERTAPGAADPDAVPALVRDLDRLTGVHAPSLAPLVRWTATPDGVVLVHRVPADSVPLDAVRRTGPLRAGHVLRVALDVAEALAALHVEGLAHGGVDLGAVLVAPDGTTVLAGTGLAWRASPGRLDGPTPEADVAAVGELVRHLLGQGAAPGALVLAALRASDPDPGLRPSAAALVDLLRSCGRADTLLDALWPTAHPAASSAAAPPATPAGAAPRPTGAAPRPGSRRTPPDAPPDAAPAPPRSGRRRAPEPTPRRSVPRISPRAVAVAAAVLVVGVGAVRAVTAVGAVAAERATPQAPSASPTAAAVPTTAAPPSTSVSSSTPAPVSPPTSRPIATDWSAVLAALDAGRREALASGDPEALARWVDPAGAAWSRDSALLDRFARSKARVIGGELVLEEVHLQRQDADRVLLAVRDRRTAYDVDEAGATTHVPERPAAWWTVTLTPVPALDGDGWRIAEVRGREDRAG